MLAAVGPGASASPFPRRAGELVPSRENLWASRVTREPPELVGSASASFSAGSRLQCVLVNLVLSVVSKNPPGELCSPSRAFAHQGDATSPPRGFRKEAFHERFTGQAVPWTAMLATGPQHGG